ncbi:MAG: glycosyltransferase [Planctomycetota bacterium]
MRVALVHECIAGYHGSERVLAEMAAVYPEAPIFVTTCRRGVLDGTPLADRDLRASFLDRLPGLRDRHRLLLPLMPHAVERHDLRGFDVVLSSHHAAAHGVLTSADQLHLCYTHSPARYAWDLHHDHLPPEVAAPLRRYLLHRFRGWDVAAASRVDTFAANSRHVARRIAKTYRREAEVIHPPVDVGRFRPDRPREDYYVTLGRLVGYKNTGAAVEAFLGTSRRLVVIGDGPQRRAIARRVRRAGADGRNVELAGALDDAAVADRLERARALVFAAHEDFGMVPVEALAAGCPVIALGRGGVLETVGDGRSGVFFDRPTTAGIREAVERFEAQGVTAGPAELHSDARAFSAEVFRGRLADWVQRRYATFLESAFCPKPPSFSDRPPPRA